MVKVFGYGAPSNFDGLKKGMLVYARPSPEQHYLGVISRVGSDFVLVVIASNGEDAPPYLINASAIHDAMWKIDGQLEIEPKGGDFTLPKIATPGGNGLIIDAAGDLFAVVVQREYGGFERYIIHLASGEHADGTNHAEAARPFATLSDFSVSVRQAGREKSFAFTSLTPDR